MADVVNVIIKNPDAQCLIICFSKTTKVTNFKHSVFIEQVELYSN